MKLLPSVVLKLFLAAGKRAAAAPGGLGGWGLCWGHGGRSLQRPRREPLGGARAPWLAGAGRGAWRLGSGLGV